MASTSVNPSTLLPLELIDKCVGSRIWVIMKSKSNFKAILKQIILFRRERTGGHFDRFR